MDLATLIEGCKDAVKGNDPTTNVMNVLGEFLRQPNPASQLGSVERSTFDVMYRADDLLVLHAFAPPLPSPVDPHNHQMWAVVGVYRGEEKNQLFEVGDDSQLEPTERFSLKPGDLRLLDPSTIHSVQSGPDDYLGAVHVYGGDLIGTPRSMWKNGDEQPLDESGLPAFFELLRRREDELGRTMTADETAALLSGARA